MQCPGVLPYRRGPFGTVARPSCLPHSLLLLLRLRRLSVPLRCTRRSHVARIIGIRRHRDVARRLVAFGPLAGFAGRSILGSRCGWRIPGKLIGFVRAVRLHRGCPSRALPVGTNECAITRPGDDNHAATRYFVTRADNHLRRPQSSQ